MLLYLVFCCSVFFRCQPASPISTVLADTALLLPLEGAASALNSSTARGWMVTLHIDTEEGCSTVKSLVLPRPRPPPPPVVLLPPSVVDLGRSVPKAAMGEPLESKALPEPCLLGLLYVRQFEFLTSDEDEEFWE